MKKSCLLIIFAIVFLLASCCNCIMGDTIVINNSSEAVEVTFRHAGLFIIPPNESVLIETVDNIHINYTPYEWVGVYHNRDQYSIIFTNRQRFSLNVRNTSTMPSMLTIHGWGRGGSIDNGNIFILEEQYIMSAGYIYTLTPQFTAIDDMGFPMLVIYVFKEGIFQVTIR